MVLVRDRTATTFALAAVANRATVAPAPSLAERFVELRKITTAYRADLLKALSSHHSGHLSDRVRDRVTAETEAFLERYMGGGVFGVGERAIGAIIGMCASLVGTVAAATVVGYEGATGNLEPGVRRWLDTSPGKALPSRKPRRGSLEDLLGRVHDVETYSPTTIAALSAMAEERLRDKQQILSEGARQALSGVVFHGELQDPVEIARSARWVGLQRALEQAAAVKDGQNATQAAKAVTAAFHALEADERAELAPLVREAVFDGEKPRKSVLYGDAVHLYGVLANASPVPPTVRVNDDVPMPEGAATLTRYGREVYALEEAIARAVNPDCRSFEGVVRELAKAQRKGPYSASNLLGYDLSSYLSKLAPLNNVIDPAAIAAAVGRARAGWHTSLERIGLKLVAQRALVLFDGLCALGPEARAMLSAIVEGGKSMEESGEERAKLNDQAQRLHRVLNHINAIAACGGGDDMVQTAIKLIDELPAEEKPEIARAVWEQAFGLDLRNAKWFPGSVQLVRKLRAEGVDP